MAWISIHDTILGAKLRDLSKKTEVSKAECIGALTILWLWGLENANEDGVILKADVDDLAEELHGKISTDPKQMVEAMIEAKWIDKEGDMLLFHDWSTWQEQWFKARKKREQDRNRTYSRNHGSGEEGGGGDQPPDDEYSPEFEELWQYYPRKITKAASYKKYLARIHEGWTHEQLLEATIAYSAEVKRKGTQDGYIKHGETFFGPSKPFKDYLRKKPDPAQEAPKQTENPFAKYKEEP